MLPEKFGKFERNPKGYERYSHNNTNIFIQKRKMTERKLRIIKKFLKNYFDYFKDNNKKMEFKIYTDRSFKPYGEDKLKRGRVVFDVIKSMIDIPTNNIASEEKFLDFLSSHISADSFTKSYLNRAEEYLKEDFYKKLKDRVVIDAL